MALGGHWGSTAHPFHMSVACGLSHYGPSMTGRERMRALDGVGTEGRKTDGRQSIKLSQTTKLPTRPRPPMSSGAKHPPSHIGFPAPKIQPTFRPLGLIASGAKYPSADKRLDMGYLIPNAHPPRAAPQTQSRMYRNNVAIQGYC